jgi:hypothetical protein
MIFRTLTLGTQASKKPMATLTLPSPFGKGEGSLIGSPDQPHSSYVLKPPGVTCRECATHHLWDGTLLHWVGCRIIYQMQYLAE